MTQTTPISPSPIPVGHFVDIAPVAGSAQRIHYHEQGEGEVVIFLHGAGTGASGYSNFKGNYPQFVAAGFRNLVVDLPGFGRSDKPEEVNYDLEFFVNTLSGFLKAVGVKRATLLGNSLGGAIALGLALAEPERVEKLILMAPGGVEERETYFKMIGIQRMVELYNAGPLGIEQMRRIMSLQLFDSSQLDDNLLAERVAVALHQPRNLFSTMLVPNMTERLEELQAPILGFWGTNDNFNPATGALKVLNHAPNARFIMLNQCGHWVQVEHRELFNKACLEFLRS